MFMCALSARGRVASVQHLLCTSAAWDRGQVPNTLKYEAKTNPIIDCKCSGLASAQTNFDDAVDILWPIIMCDSLRNYLTLAEAFVRVSIFVSRGRIICVRVHAMIFISRARPNLQQYCAAF